MAQYIVSSGVTFIGVSLYYDSLYVYDGGTVKNTNVNSHGGMVVSSGGLAGNTTVCSGGSMIVSSGGMISGMLQIESGANISASCGSIIDFSVAEQTDPASVLIDHWSLISGGNDADYTLTINADQAEGNYLLALNAADFERTISVKTVDAHSVGTISVGNSLDYNRMTYMLIQYGDALVLTVNQLNGIRLYSSSVLIGSATMMNGVVLSGGVNNSMIVYQDGIANSNTVNDGGVLCVSSGGVANNTIINSQSLQIFDCKYPYGNEYCNLNVFSGGTANGVTVNVGGCMAVSCGGTATDIAAASGAILKLSVSPDTYIQGVSAGSAFEIANGFVEDYSIDSYGCLDVFSGGTVFRTIVNEKCFLIINSGGIASTSIVNSCGHLWVSGGGMANTTAINPDGELCVFSGGVVNGTTINGDDDSCGHLIISSGGEANSTTVNSCGCMDVSRGGVANGFSISEGGILSVRNGGVATNFNAVSGASLKFVVASDTYIQGTAAGSAFEIADGYVEGYSMNEGDSLDVFSGCTASNTTVNSRSNMYISGVAKNTAVNSGGNFSVFSGGMISGTLQVTDGAVVSAYAGAIIDFTVAEQETATTALINNWSLISGGADSDYTLTVKVHQHNGTYVLAEGAENFNAAICVKTTRNDILGSLSVGETKRFREVDYALTKSDDKLLLTIAGAFSNARSDLDGNGISDVMFQWTGGDRQIGFWMNGTSTWQSTGASQPDNWTLLGNYDMDANSKADQVMVGNVLGGAYIGYYKDGDTTSNGWVTIGYLNNPDGIKWDNVIGNLTGNAGKNSIVWHAPELNACGVWTDGTTEWVGISGSFDESWQLQGCGDFDGNGKDEILWKCNGNLYTTDINSNFASLGNASGWEVRAIGDFSGDGKDDIVLFHSETGSVMKYENGKAENWVSLGQLDASDWFIVGAGDYNGDTEDDLLVRQYSTGMLGYYESGDMSKWVEMGRGVDMNWTVIA